MSVNSSGFGIEVQIVASNTFPLGYTATQFSEDANAIDVPVVPIADAAKGVNGDLIYWTVANRLDLTLNVIGGSDDDKNFSILLQANRASRGKRVARDIIRMTLLYPNGDRVQYLNGVMLSGAPSTGIAGTGRVQTMAYLFTFEDFIFSRGSESL